MTETFGYDAFGRRTAKGSTGYLYDGLNAVQELSGTTPTANLLSGGLDEVFLRVEAGGSRFFLNGGLGSTEALVDASGAITTRYTYDAFGLTSETGASSTNPFRYTGREDDGTGLYSYRARYYSPRFHRFISEDPLGYTGGDFNFYSYAMNDPINYTDPLGLDAVDNFADYVAGAGDSLTFGGTSIVRRMLNDGQDVVDKCSGWYSAGEYSEVVVEIVATGGSAALKQAAKGASRRLVRKESRKLTRHIQRGGKELSHNNPLFGHPGGGPTLFPTGGLPAWMHSGNWNLSLLEHAEHVAAHRQMRALEDIGSAAVNPLMTYLRTENNSMSGRKCE